MSDVFIVGEVVSGEITFTAENIREMAALLGDTNAIHHAADPRYGALVACGGHIAGRAMSIAAAHVTARAPGALGRNWHVRFRLPVLAGDVMRIEWTVLSLTPHPRGTLLTFEGKGMVQRGDTHLLALTASGDAVLFDAEEASVTRE